MIQGILFDYDGTLSARYESAYHMYRHIMQECRPDLDDESIEFESMVQRCMYWDEYGTAHKSYVLEQMKANYCPNLNVKQWEQRWRDEFYLYQVAMPGMLETLPELKKKYRIGIITNGDGPSQNRKIDTLGLRRYCHTVIASGDLGFSKPDPEIFLHAAEDLGLYTSEVAFIGDTFHTDVLGAYNAGMLPVWYCYERRTETLYDVKKVHDFEEIRDMFLVHDEWNV